MEFFLCTEEYNVYGFSEPFYLVESINIGGAKNNVNGTIFFTTFI